MTALQRLGIIVALLLAAAGTGWLLGNAHGAAKASAAAQAAQTQSDQAEGASKTHAAQAAASDQQAIKDKAAITDTDAQAASAKRELDRRLAALHGDAPASHPSHASLRATGAPVGGRISPTGSLGHLPAIPGNPGQSRAIRGQSVGNSNSPGIPDSSALTVAALAQAQIVIEDQQAQIAARDRLIASLTVSRDEWKASAQEAQKALALQKVAMDAAVRSERASGLRAQLVRGLEGLAVGYAVGRLQR